MSATNVLTRRGNRQVTPKLRSSPFAFLRVHSRFQKNVDFRIEGLLKFQKKPVNPPKFTFQHSTQSPLVGGLVVKFDQSQNVESFPSLPSLPSVQVLSRSRTCRTNSSKMPDSVSRSERPYLSPDLSDL